MPRKISIESLFQRGKNKYLAIVFFTIQFSNEIKWFRLYHYRYALQKNHDIRLSFQRYVPVSFDRDLQNEYKNAYSFIKKCFNSRSNLIDHINKLVYIGLLEKKFTNGEYHYRLKDNYIDKIFYAYDCAWFSALNKKVPHDLLRKIKNHIETEFKDELQKYNALLLAKE